MTLTVAMLVALLIYLKKHIQEHAQWADEQRLTVADYAIMLSGLKQGVDVDGKDGLEALLRADLAALGFGAAQIDHIACGARGRGMVQLLRKLGELNVKKQELQHKQDAKGLAALRAKEVVDFEKLREMLETSDDSTGHAVVVFKAEADRVACQKQLTQKGLKLRAVSETAKLKVEAADEPDAIKWDNLELSKTRERCFRALGQAGSLGLARAPAPAPALAPALAPTLAPTL